MCCFIRNTLTHTPGSFWIPHEADVRCRRGALQGLFTVTCLQRRGGPRIYSAVQAGWGCSGLVLNDLGRTLFSLCPPAPPCRLFVHKSACCGELGQTIAWLSYYQCAQWSGGMRLRFGGLWFGRVGRWMLLLSIMWRSHCGGELGFGGKVVGTSAHLDWDHVAKQLDFFHGAAGK